MEAQVVNLTIRPQERPEAADAAGVRAGLRDALVRRGHLAPTDFDKVARLSAESHGERSIVDLLVSLGVVAERDLAAVMADLSGLPLADDADYLGMTDGMANRFLLEHLVVPVGGEAGAWRLIMVDPGDAFALAAARLALDGDVEPVVGVRSDVERAVRAQAGDEPAVPDEAGDGEADIDVEHLRDLASEAPVVRLVNQLLQGASDASASDIHIEPFDELLKVRYRIDGVLHDTEAPPPHMAAAVISRVKIMAHLDIAERRLPQDGRIRLRLQGRDIDARVSTVPTMHGECVVMRLLNRNDVSLDLDKLGFDAPVHRKFRDALRMPNGMVLVTGPTGSGKTTTLYTALHLLNTEQRKIITAEDPVEYQMAGVNQIQVNAAIGLSFARVLRSVVRQDPDVILVGEMRDIETARICVQSALTGHLVLSTLHTNSAASSVTRLLEMGIEDYLLASTLNAVVSQRLVRVLCPHCKQGYEPGDELRAELALDRVTDGNAIRLYRPVGCDACNDTGYRGRHAILELLPVTGELRRLIIGGHDAAEIESAAVAKGMRTIFEDGCAKAAAGITSIEEVMRVIQEG